MANTFPNFTRSPRFELFTDEAASVTGTPVFVGNYRHIIVEIVTTGSVSGIIEILSGYGTEAQRNMSPQHSRNVDTDASVPGSTGLTISAAGTYKLLVNTDYIDWLQVDLTHTSGTFSAYAHAKEG